jgi:glycosyltransferase involved in cell wall biosynthesis
LARLDPALDILLVLFHGDARAPLPANVRVTRLGVKPRGNPLYAVLKFFRVVLGLARIFRREGPCAVLSFMDYPNLVSLLANRLAGSRNRMVVSVHTRPTAQSAEHAADLRERAVGLLIGRLYNRAAVVVAVSPGVGEDLAENFGIDQSRLRVIPNPVDLSRIAALAGEEVAEDLFAEGTPVILAVGRLSREKGHDTLLKAFARVRETTPAKLALVGEGQEEESLRRLSRSLGVEADVAFLGYQANPFRYMRRSALLVLPSLYEGFGLVLVEAMACGTPVVATRSYRGIEAIVEHERTGLLVEVGDDEALAAAMVRLLGDAGLRRRLAEQARRRAEAFDIGPIAQRYLAVLGLTPPNPSEDVRNLRKTES